MKKNILNRIPGFSRFRSSPEEPWLDPARDQRINEETSPPSDERVRFVSITVTEAYPPSFLPALEEGLERLGVEDEGGGSQSPLAWIKTTNENFDRISWLNIGEVTSTKSFPYGIRNMVDPTLPKSIDRVSLAISKSIPTLFLATATFLFTEHSAGLIHDATLEKFDTTASRISKTRTLIHDPYNKKRQRVRLIDANLTDDCTSWLRATLPGLFGTFEGSTTFPLIKLVTLESTEPLPDRPSSNASLFLDMLGLLRHYPVWSSEDLTGLKLIQTDSYSSRHHFVLTGRRQNILKESDLQSYGGRDDRGIVNRLTHELQSMNDVLAHYAVLNAFAARISAHRDELARLALTSRKAATRLQTIHRTVAKTTSEAMSVGTFLGEGSIYSKMALLNLPKFVIGDDRLFENIRRAILSLAPQIERSASDLIGSTTTTASLLNSEKQEKLQRRILFFTMATFIATAAAVTIALSSYLGIEELRVFWEWLKAIRD